MAPNSTSSYIAMMGDDPETRQHLITALGLPVQAFSDRSELSNRESTEIPSALFWIMTSTTNAADFESIQNIKGRWPSCAIIVLGEFQTQDLIMQAMRSGATDFAFKPIQPAEIRLRLQLHHARTMGLFDMNTIRFGDIMLDTVHNMLSGPGGTRSISTTETALLAILTHATGDHPINKTELKQQCWRGHLVTDNALHRKLHAVRQLLREISNTVVIQTKYGIGFYLKSIHVSMKIAS